MRNLFEEYQEAIEEMLNVKINFILSISMSKIEFVLKGESYIIPTQSVYDYIKDAEINKVLDDAFEEENEKYKDTIESMLEQKIDNITFVTDKEVGFLLDGEYYKLPLRNVLAKMEEEFVI